MPNPEPAAQPTPFKRRADLVLSVCQREERQAIEILDVNDPFLETLGYARENLRNQPLPAILSGKDTELLVDYLEYGEDGNDLSSVFGKLSSIRLKDRAGALKAFRIRVVRAGILGRDPCFHLILRDEDTVREAENFREVLRDNFKGHEVLDPETGLPNRHSLMKDADLVRYHVDQKRIDASVALIGIDHFDHIAAANGRAKACALVQDIAALCKTNLRGEDTVGLIRDGVIGMLLIDADEAGAQIVLNRLRWAIASKQELGEGLKDEFNFSISFAPIPVNANVPSIIETCENSLGHAPLKAVHHAIKG